MAKFLKLVGGIPKSTDVTATINQYDESVPVTTDIGTAGAGYDAAHKVFTLPNAETYDGTIDELKVDVNGVGQVEGVEYNYDNNVAATTVTFIDAIPKNARVRFFKVT